MSIGRSFLWDQNSAWGNRSRKGGINITTPLRWCRVALFRYRDRQNLGFIHWGTKKSSAPSDPYPRYALEQRAMCMYNIGLPYTLFRISAFIWMLRYGAEYLNGVGFGKCSDALHLMCWLGAGELLIRDDGCGRLRDELNTFFLKKTGA